MIFLSELVENVKYEVYNLLNDDNSGHGIDHIDRVLMLSMKFAKTEKNCNKEIISLIALLHDVDDYKLFGLKNAENLTNTKRILDKCNVDSKIKSKILESVKCIGYSKRLKGLVPNSIEGKIVSDADMCDALGVTGILRSYEYNLKNNNRFFDKNNFPMIDMDANTYINKKNGTVVNHIFEKLLKLKSLMLTEEGKKEANIRHEFMINFLYQFFSENNVPEWERYLSEYLNRYC